MLIEIPDYADYENLTIQVYNDNMWKYGVPSDLQQIPVVSETTTVHSLYSPLRKIERSDILYGRRGNKIFRIKFNSRRRQYRNGRVCDFRRQLRLFPVARPNVDNQRGLSVSIKKNKPDGLVFFALSRKIEIRRYVIDAHFHELFHILDAIYRPHAYLSASAMGEINDIFTRR